MPLTAALHNVLSSLEKQSLASCLNLNLAVILATCHKFGRVLFSSIIANSFTAAAKGVPVGPIIYYFLFSLSAPVLQNLRLRHIDTIEEGNARHSIFLLLRNDYICIVLHCIYAFICRVSQVWSWFQSGEPINSKVLVLAVKIIVRGTETHAGQVSGAGDEKWLRKVTDI